MKSISKPSLFDNLGGVLKVWAIPPTAITVTGNIVSISSQLNVIQIYSTQDETSAVFSKKIEKGNMVYNIEVSGITYCKTSSDEDILKELEQKKWVVIVQDGNNLFKLFGLPGEKLSFEMEEDTGKATNDRNMVSFSFVGKTQIRPFYIPDPF